MRIIINKELYLDNSQLDNDNFVDLIIETEVENVQEVTASIDDLYAAVEAFIKVRQLNNQRDKLYEN